MILHSYIGNGTADVNLPLMTIHAIFYNQVRFAGATLRSMLAQTYGNVEVIASDDCSADGTAEVLLEVARGYTGPHRLIVNINKRNMGIGDHFAYVHSLSHGEWQTSLGGDDLAEPNYLQTVHDYAVKYPDVIAIGCSAATIDEEGNTLGAAYQVKTPTVYPQYRSGPFSLSLNPGDNVTSVPVTGCVASYRKTLIAAAPFPKGIVSEDLFLGLRASLLGDVLFVPEKCVRQRMSTTSVTRGGHRAPTRKERTIYRRKMARMTFLSVDAALKDVLVLRPDVDKPFCAGLLLIADENLLASFALPEPFGVNLPRYLDALHRVCDRTSIRAVLKKARACGVLCKVCRLFLRIFL